MRSFRMLSCVLSSVLLAGVVTVSQAIPVAAAEPATALAPATRDVAAATAEARASGDKVEVTDATTETLRRWANPDGTLTDEVAAGPVRIKQDGRWVPIDTMLAEREGAIRPTATMGDVRFSAGGDTTLASVAKDGVEVALTWPKPLPEPTVKENAATYADVLPGVDLEMKAVAAGYEQSFILKNRAAASTAQLRVPLSTRGVNPAMTNGQITFRDASGTDRAWIGAARMWDASGREAPVGVAVVPHGSGRALNMVPDAKFLADPSIEFPVTVDPTVIVYRFRDAYINEAAPTTTYGTSTALKIGIRSTNYYVSYIEFALSAYAGKKILNVDQYLGISDSVTCTGKTTTLYKVTTSWTSTVTWNTHPTTDLSSGGVLATSSTQGGGPTGSSCAANAWMKFNDARLTAQYQTWANSDSTNHGMSIRASSTDTQAAKDFASGEAGSWTPRTHITYNTPPTIDWLAVTASPAKVWSCCGLGQLGFPDAYPQSWWSNTTTPTVTSKPCDADGHATRVDYEVWSEDTTVKVTSSLATRPRGVLVCGTDKDEWTPTLLSGVNGIRYNLRYRAYDGYEYSEWSMWQQWVIDTTPPPVPTVTSAQYPENTWAGGPDQTGTFTFSSELKAQYEAYLDDADRKWGFASDPKVTYTAPYGVHTLKVKAVDMADNYSVARQYVYKVAKVPPAPTNVVATTTGADSAEVKWTAPANPDNSAIDRYDVAVHNADTGAFVKTVTAAGTATTAPVTSLNGNYYVKVSAHNTAGNGPSVQSNAVTVPARRPAPPTNVTAVAQDTAADVSWTAGADYGSPISNYTVRAYLTATAEEVAQKQAGTSTTTRVDGLTNGLEYYFTVTATNGGGTSDASQPSNVVTPFDPNGPDAPVIASTTHGQDTWTANRDASFTWTAAGASLAHGYSVVFDDAPGTVPDTTADTFVASWNQNGMADGEHWLHVRAADFGGRWGTAGHYRVRVDATAPTGPVVSSPTHPDEQRPYENHTMTFTWVPPAEVSGITGYSWQLDQSIDAVPDMTVDGTGTTVTFENSDDGTWFFHVRARNGAGEWGATTTFTASVWMFAEANTVSGPGSPQAQVTPDHGVVPNPTTLVAPPIVGLESVLPRGGLFGDDGFFGGEVLPDTGLAGALAGAAGSVLPPGTPVVNTGNLTRTALGAVAGIRAIVPPITLLPSPTYTLDVVRFNQDGTQTESTNVFPVCAPQLFHPARPGDEVPGVGTPDMRVNFCPDATSFDPADPGNANRREQRATYQLDALTPGSYLRATVTYAYGVQQVRAIADGQLTGIPQDTGTGTPASDPAYPCQNNTISTVLTGDTTDGFCQELRFQPRDGGAMTAWVTTSTSAALTGQGLYLDDLPSGEAARPVYHFAVANLPASPEHTYQLDGYGPTAVRGRVELVDTVANPGEGWLLEQFDAEGRPETQLRLGSSPTSYVIDFNGTLDAQGDIALVTIGGTQGAARLSQTLTADRFLAGVRTAHLDISSFARSYAYTISAVRDDQDRLVGVSGDASFENGIPANGRLALYQYAGSNAAEVARLEVDEFSSNLDFDVVATGDPADPTGATIDVINAESVPGQTIRVLRAEPGTVRTQLVFAGGTANVPWPVIGAEGRNLLWTAMPRSFHLTLGLTDQTEGSGAGTPGQVSISGTAVAPDAESRLHVTDVTGGGELGLVLKGISTDHTLTITAEGSLAELRRLAVDRDSKTVQQPAQALQLYARQSGVLTGAVRFLGASATTTGLVGGTPRDVEGSFGSLPAKWTTDLAVTRTDGRITSARLSGTNGVDSPAMTAGLVDRRTDTDVRLTSMPTTWSYVVASTYDNAGVPLAATLSGAFPADNPAGVVDVRADGVRLLAENLTQTVRYHVERVGPLADPRSMVVEQDLSSQNPDQLLQLATYAPGSNTARFAATFRNRAGATLPESGSVADFVWTTVPADFRLTAGRSATSGGEQFSMGLTLPGGDVADGRLRVRQHRSTGRQEAFFRGLANGLTVSGSVAELTNEGPDRLHLDVRAPVRRATDLVQLLNYLPSGALGQQLVFDGDATVDPETGVSPTIAEARMNAAPPGLVLDYNRDRYADGEKEEKAVTVDVTTLNGAGQQLQAPAATMDVELRTNGSVSDKMSMSSLPSTFHLGYVRPARVAVAGTNCLGDIAYQASSSTLDLTLEQFKKSGCFGGGSAGAVRATVDGMPSQGFEAAFLRPNGDGEIRTKVVGDARQIVPRMHVSLPVPSGAAQFVQNPAPIHDKVCSEMLVSGIGCAQVDIDAKVKFTDLRLEVDARKLQDVLVQTNIDADGTPKAYPASFDQESDDRVHAMRLLWDTIPLFAIRNRNIGSTDATVIVRLTGRDDPSEAGYIRQRLQPQGRIKKGPINYTYDAGDPLQNEIPVDGRDLRVRFYGWQADPTCMAPPNQPLVPRRCNRSGQELTRDFGQVVHTHGDDTSVDAVPFDPGFDQYEPAGNSFFSTPSSVSYYVPNLYDRFLSDIGDMDSLATPSRWYMLAAASTPIWVPGTGFVDGNVQSDWFFSSLLREYSPDPMGLIDAA